MLQPRYIQRAPGRRHKELHSTGPLVWGPAGFWSLSLTKSFNSWLLFVDFFESKLPWRTDAAPKCGQVAGERLQQKKKRLCHTAEWCRPVCSNSPNCQWEIFITATEQIWRTGCSVRLEKRNVPGSHWEVFVDASAKECRLLFSAYQIECLFGILFFFQWLLKNVSLVVLGTFDIKYLDLVLGSCIKWTFFPPLLINTKHIDTHHLHN